MREWLQERKASIVALGIVCLLFGAPVVALLWATAVPGQSFAGALPPLTSAQAALAERLRGHIVAIASEPHNVGHAEAYERAARHIETSLSSIGYAVVRQPFDAGKARNIEVIIAPVSPAAPTLVIGAHYDSALTAPGANDNATGTAAVLELARNLTDLRGKAAVRIRLVLFGNEEPPFFQTGRMGSVVYADRLSATGERIVGMLSLETLGYYRVAPGSQHYPFPLSYLYPDTGDFVAFVGTTSSRPLVRRVTGAFRNYAAFPSVGGTAPAFVQGIDWSDHWAFDRLGIPAVMVTDTAPFRYPWYHSVDDTPDKIDAARLARVVQGLERVVRDWR